MSTGCSGVGYYDHVAVLKRMLDDWSGRDEMLCWKWVECTLGFQSAELKHYGQAINLSW